MLFDRSAVRYKKEELLLLAQKIVSDASGSSKDSSGTVGATYVATFCFEEADRQQWTIISSRLRNSAKNAYIAGVDLEELLSEKDSSNTQYISVIKFKEFLNQLAPYGKLSVQDINLCCRHFSKRTVDSDIQRHAAAAATEHERDGVSLQVFMAFLGREYVGGVQARLRRLVAAEGNAERLTHLLRQHIGSNQKQVGTFGVELVLRVFDELGAFKDVSREQVRGVLTKLEPHGRAQEQLSASALYAYLDLPLPNEFASKVAQVSEEPAHTSVEELLRVLLERVQSGGALVTDTFRYFDTNGDGQISRAELEEGFGRLAIFDHIPNYRSQLPALMDKFDNSGDGVISLKEFFSFLGIKSYTPDIIQRMTKVFAVATEKGLSFRDIFTQLDRDGNGTLDRSEIAAGLNELKTFGEVSEDDATTIISHFDKVEHITFIFSSCRVA